MSIEISQEDLALVNRYVELRSIAIRMLSLNGKQGYRDEDLNLFTLALTLLDATKHARTELRDNENPRGFCPDCGADVGNFYSNRIRWKR